MNSYNRLKKCGVIPVVVIENADDALPSAKALLRGGIDVMEITFRTPDAPKALALVTENLPDMLCGAGTITTLEQCKSAISLGASFIVCPGFSEEIVMYCKESDIPVVPGCVTPTEIMQATRCGLDIVKFFPANVFGGIGAMKNLAAPFGNIKFIPTGGVCRDNLSEYLSEKFIFAVGGSWLCSKSDIREKNFEKITELCQESRKIIDGIRGRI